MADDWALLLSVGIIFTGLGVMLFYLIPLQTKIALQPKDWLTGFRWRMVAATSMIVLLFAPSIVNRVLLYFGIQSALLSNVSAITTALALLGFSISMVSLYHYKKKE